MQSFRWLTVAVASAAGMIWLIALGTVPVIRISTATTAAVPFWYMATAFPVLGMLVADVVVLWAFCRARLYWIELACQVAVLILISFLRLSLKLPVSGHSLLFAYFIFRRAVIPIPPHRTRKLEMTIAVALFLATASVKIFWWGDYVTLILGVIIASVMTFFSYLIIGRRNFKTSRKGYY